MIVDSSAIAAIVGDEPEGEAFAGAIEAADQVRMASPTFVEIAVLIDCRGDLQAVRKLDALVAEVGIEIVPFSAEHARIARDAYRRFGKGNHPARLNFGDCFAYALSKATGEPLLFKGEDFGKTDVTPAVDVRRG